MGEHAEDRPREACGVVGIHAPGEQASNLAYYGLFALQHRGQESAGIAASEGDAVTVVKGMGLVSQVFNTEALASLPGHLAIGHVRYSTTGSSSWENSQPSYKEGGEIAIALGHNGNLINTLELAEACVPEPTFGPVATTDSDVMATLIASSGAGSAEAAMLEVLPKLEGAFSVVAMTEDTLFGARDPHGLRPLVLGRLEHGYALASETCALDIIGATLIREVDPGELVTIDAQGLRSQHFAPAQPALCIFEFVYFARPDSKLFGKSVYKTRYEMGRRLAGEAPVEADLVMGVPETALAAAAGYSAQSHIPYGEGFIKNRYVGRTFIQPTQLIRQQGIRAKLNPLHEVIEGRRLVVVDDSIVRGNTQRALVRMLREAGALEVHVRISSPPVKWPCFYGIDFASRAELIANGLDTDGVRRSIGADTLGYVSIEGLIAASEQPRSRLCMA
ncbi:MAG TPA: amidophosphoribosyltransferase, partial [Actinomycetota bacterium]|nr:amidophosphoribosyltransferase [Actinomycetota bacterium]